MIDRIVVLIGSSALTDIVIFDPAGVCTYGDPDCLSNYGPSYNMTISIEGTEGSAQLCIDGAANYCSGSPAKVTAYLDGFPGNSITDLFVGVALPA